MGTTSVAESQGVLVYNFTVADDHTYFVEGFGDNAGAGAGADASSSLLDAVWVHNNCAGSFTVGGEDLAARARQLLNLAPKIYTRNMTTIAVAVGRNEAGEIMTAVASSEARLRSEQMLARSLFENPVEGVDGIHAEVKAVKWLESQGFSQIIAVGASRRICQDCVPQLLARGLEMP